MREWEAAFLASPANVVGADCGYGAGRLNITGGASIGQLDGQGGAVGERWGTT